MFVSLLTVIILLAAPLRLLGAESAYDRFGGWMGLKSEATGYFRAEEINGIWWLIDPEGNAFISKGVDNVSYTADRARILGYSPYEKITQAKYGNIGVWAKAAVQRLQGWNLNTLGAWSSRETFDKGMPYTFILGIARAAGASGQRGVFPDIFSEEFAANVENRVKEFCIPCAQDPYLLGYFLDNELHWGPNWSTPQPLFDDFFKMAPEAPGKKALVRILNEVYGGIAALNAAWGTNCRDFSDILIATKISDLGGSVAAVEKEVAKDDSIGRYRLFPKEISVKYLDRKFKSLEKVNETFGTHAKSYDEFLTPRPLSPTAREVRRIQRAFLKALAERYFKVSREAIRKFDPNHMILGCRFAGYAPAGIEEVIGKYVDVISFNDYSVIPPRDRLEALYKGAGKPIMITEFSFKAMDSGLPNTGGAGFPLKTQEERADCFAGYVEALLSMPFAVGFHWFEHTDQPAEGRSDGENCNYGVVNIKDEPWEVLVNRMTTVNLNIDQLHMEKSK